MVPWGTGIGVDGRKDVLDRVRKVVTNRLYELVEVVHLETGKPRPDATLEAGLALDHLQWAAAHAKKVLGRRRMNSGLLMANQAAQLEYRPRSEEHTSELQSLMRISYAVFCLKKQKTTTHKL